MNNLLQLKGSFEKQVGKTGGGARTLPVNSEVEGTHILKLIKELESIYNFWNTNPLIKGALVNVCYTNVIAKSNRIKSLLCLGSEDPNDYIRGAKFLNSSGHVKHVFTYYVGLDVISETIRRLKLVSEVIENDYNGKILASDIDALNDKRVVFKYETRLSKNNFISAVVDTFYSQEFFVDFSNRDELYNSTELSTSIISFYKTDVSTKDVLNYVGINTLNVSWIDDYTVLLKPDDIRQLLTQVPYLISMKVRDFREVANDFVMPSPATIMQIPSPQNEPVIGVIDTPFFEDVYFKEWVDYTCMLDQNIHLESKDFNHGTEVTSIIVDGPSINPNLDDGCGRFRVKHFGVTKQGGYSSYSILHSIRQAVAQNRDIKVWNLSLGSILPINSNFISPEAAELDRIQNEFDVIFVIAGTNSNPNHEKRIAIGAPADSINSLVVNSVTLEGKAASYHRVGPVLSFFHKPDVSYYGGDKGQWMRVCGPMGENFVQGTSFAAPWITRKIAYLINVLGLPREVAKALIIDSAAGWDRKDDVSCSIGYGVVPKRIEDIVQTANDEIRFVMSGLIHSYETYTYKLPVPIFNDKHPFYARATLCYFPKCLRSQGVDYTLTEMDLHFGRVVEKNGKSSINSINSNSQGDTNGQHLYENEARQIYRKWDNIKHINDELKKRAVPRKKFDTGMWGLSIKTKERLKEKNGHGLSFGIVITLKEMNGKNRIDDFIKRCQAYGWIVNQISIINRVSIYNKEEEKVKF